MAATKEMVTKQFRDFSGGMNRNAARSAMKDNQVFWCENAQPHGAGQLQILSPAGATLATIAAGIASMTGVTLKIGTTETPVIITVNNDGSMSQIVVASGAVTAVAPAGTVTTLARITMWQDTPVLIIDPTKGYFKWDGAGFSVVDAARLGTDIAVFEGRVWIVSASRTITFTAPTSNTDFTVGNGGGSTTITDNIFQGGITRLLSALELLWIIGPSAVNAIANVQATGVGPVVTTFSNTNIVANVGTSLPSSVTSFFRTFLFLTPYGTYAVVGATPQKLSDDLDDLFTSLVLSSDAPAAVFSLNSVFIWAVLVTYTDPVLGNRPLLLCFSRGVWFVASQTNPLTNPLTWITAAQTTLANVGTLPQLYGTDGTHVFRCFAGTAAGFYDIRTKLWDFGEFTTRKQCTRLAMEFTSPSGAISGAVTMENESGNDVTAAAITPQSTIQFVNSGGANITFVGAGAITWISGGFVFALAAIDFAGNYLGLELTGTSLPFTFNALAMEIEPMGPWTFPTS